MTTAGIITGGATLAQATVDLGAVAHNTKILTGCTTAQVMAVVKADAFRHGLLPVARTALSHGATWLGVTSTTEALALRAAGIDAPILSWLHRYDSSFASAITAGVDLSVSTVTHLHMIAAAAERAGQPAQVHLKSDTGLSRNGAVGADWPELVTWARRYELGGRMRVRAIWSHLADADSPASPGSPASPTVQRQVAAYEGALAVARAAGLDPLLRHLANSAATLTAPHTHYDLVRVGIALYGVEPIPGRRFGLRPALSLRSSVINVKRVPAGTGVSYHHDHVTGVATTLALIPVGYADGVPRAAGGKARVWLGGARCPIVGRVAMDQCVVDVGDAPVRIGDEVVLFGDPAEGDADEAGATEPGRGVPTVSEWARWCGTNPHEILTGLGARVDRSHKECL